MSFSFRSSNFIIIFSKTQHIEPFMDFLALFLKVNYGVRMIPVSHLKESTFEMNQRFINAHIKSKDASFPGWEESGGTKSPKHF